MGKKYLNLNTSNVNVNRIYKTSERVFFYYLNTSNVNVNPNGFTTHSKVLILFKYI